MAFAASLDNSDDHRPTVKTRSLLIAHRPALTQRNRSVDAHLRYPVGIDLSEGRTSINTLRCLQRTDQNTVRPEEIIDGRALSQEFWIRKNIEPRVRPRVCFQDRSHGFSRTAWYGRLLNDNLGRGSDSGNPASGELNVTVTWERSGTSVSTCQDVLGKCSCRRRDLGRE